MSVKNRMTELLSEMEQMDGEARGEAHSLGAALADSDPMDIQDGELDALAHHMWLGMPNAPDKPMDAAKWAQARLKKLASNKGLLMQSFKLMNRTGKAASAARKLAKDIAKKH